MSTIVAPTRTHEQRLEALGRANQIRIARAQLKRQLAARNVDVVEVLTAPRPAIEGMRVIDIVLAVPKYGEWKTRQLLLRLRISTSKTVGGLSDRQRGEIVAHFQGDRS